MIALQSLFITITVFGQQFTVSSGGVNLYPGNKSQPAIQSIGQASVIGNFNANSYVLSQGFIHPVSGENKTIKKSIELQANIYPNPVVDKVVITIVDKVASPVLVEICDLLGKRVYNEKFSPAQTIELYLSNYNSGFYFIKINTGKQQLTTKIIKGS